MSEETVIGVSGPGASRRALTATVVIATHNRREELRTALESAVAQEGPVEVLVVDDGSTDGTAEMVRRDFPQVELVRSEVSRGYIAQRNAAARLAKGDIVVSIDDDAEFRSPRAIADTLTDFDDPRIGAVAIPGIDVRHASTVRQAAPDRTSTWVTPSYWGTAHALRRDLFLELGGYREDLGEMFEEVDYCLRLLDSGHVTRLGNAEPLHHYESPKRLQPRKVYFVWRNNVGHAWRNVPMPYAPVRILKLLGLAAVSGARTGSLGAVARGIGRGFLDAPRLLRERRPVSRRTYRLDHDLRKRGPLPLEAIASRLR
jgi:GT2 family glycosyltransferase